MEHSKEFQEIIDRFTGDYAQDLNLLADEISRLGEAGNMALATELMDHANAMMEERRAKEPATQKDYATAYTEEEGDLEAFYSHLEAAMARIQDGAMEEAEKLLLEIPKVVPSVGERIRQLEAGEELRSFQNLVEEVLYRITNPTDLSPVYGPETQILLSFLGALYLDMRKHREAVDYLTLSLKANPIDCNSLLGLSKGLRLLGDHAAAREVNDRVFSAAHVASDLAEAFANEGYFLYREEEADLAYSMYAMALQYDGENEIAQGNFMLLKNKYPMARAVSKKEFSAYMKGRNLPETVSEETVKILETLAKKAEEEGQYDLAMSLWVDLDDLLDDPAIHQHIHELAPRYYEEHQEFLEDIGHGHHHHHDHDHHHHHHDHDHHDHHH
ncbi:MAG: hypothetical protein Q4E76_06240 [Tissierellia bacterium]|nr:hypothetical protein [Tissierellia bacterium]